MNAAEFTNISYQAEQSRSGADSKIEVEMPSLAAGGEEGLTVLGGSMEETKLQQRQNRNKPKDVYVDVANFTDLSVSGEKTGSFLINGIESPAVENIEAFAVENIGALQWRTSTSGTGCITSATEKN